MKKSIEVSGVDHKNSFLLGLVTFVNEVASDLQSSLSGSLTVTALEHEELAVLNGELHVLHIVIVVLEDIANLDEISISFGELLCHLSNRHRSTNACNNVLALCVSEELTHELLLTCSRISCEGNACTGVVVQVTEYHGHYVNCSTPGIRDIVVTTVNICTGVVPRTEYSLDSELELLNRIRGEVRTELLLVLCLELLSKCLEVSSGELYIVMYALFFLHLVDELLKVLLADFHNNVGEHLDKSSVRVVNESLELRIGVASDHSSNNVVVKTEVEDCIHHTGHGSSCAGTNGNEKGILKIAELLAVFLFHPSNTLHSLSHDLVVDLSAVLIVLSAGLGGDSKALRNRKTYLGHFSKVSALTAEKVTHSHITFFKSIDPFFCHWILPPYKYRFFHGRNLRIATIYIFFPHI